MKMRCRKARKNISLAMDHRLEPPALGALREHLQDCPACRDWKQEQSMLLGMIQAQPALHPSPRFFAGLQDRIDPSPARPKFHPFFPNLFRPALLRAAMVLVLIVSAVLGFSLGDRLEAPAAQTDAAAFSQALNLDAFADLPAGSFGAVYDRLLQGEIQ